ncbi:hypothetical protein QFZ67_003901 [Streptomyces sp. V1I1]|nr:hypothetical protein [Streptomyces sp. V1I1]
MPREGAAVLPYDLHPQAVGAVPLPDLWRHGRRAHLPHGRSAQHALVALGKERGEAAEVGHRRPELSGRGHQAEVLGGFGQHHIGPGMHRPATGMRSSGLRARTVQGERFKDLAAQDVLPGRPAYRLDQRTEQRIAGVGVVVTAADGMHPRLVTEDIGEFGAERARRPLPPGRRSFSAQSGAVAKELCDGHIPHARARQVLLQGIVQIEQTLVAESQHQDGREGLCDRADAVLGVGVRPMPVDRAAGARPEQLSLALHSGDERGCAPFGLGDRNAMQYGALRGGEKLFKR